MVLTKSNSFSQNQTNTYHQIDSSRWIHLNDSIIQFVLLGGWSIDKVNNYLTREFGVVFNLDKNRKNMLSKQHLNISTFEPEYVLTGIGYTVNTPSYNKRPIAFSLEVQLQYLDGCFEITILSWNSPLLRYIYGFLDTNSKLNLHFSEYKIDVTNINLNNIQWGTYYKTH